MTKVDQDFDFRRVENVANKYVPRSDVYKRTKVSHILYSCLFLQLVDVFRELNLLQYILMQYPKI